MKLAITPACKLSPASRFWGFLGFMFTAMWFLYVGAPLVAALGFVPSPTHCHPTLTCA